MFSSAIVFTDLLSHLDGPHVVPVRKEGPAGEGRQVVGGLLDGEGPGGMGAVRKPDYEKPDYEKPDYEKTRL